MIRQAIAGAMLCMSALAAGAEERLAASPPRVDMAGTQLTTNWRGVSTLHLAFSKHVSFRVFTLDDPARLVIDLKGVDAAPFSRDLMLADQDVFDDARMGAFARGWTRFVADLSKPLVAGQVALTSADPRTATLTVRLDAVTPEVFAQSSGSPPALDWARQMQIPPPADRSDAFVVVIDPGHGGIDPGAERGGVSEKALMLDLARRLADRLQKLPDTQVILTRRRDVFVSLDARVGLAQAAHADLFLSLHADALPEGGAQGATLYTLSDRASDAATAQLAARHNRADVLAGADLTEAEDQVTQVLLDIARRETKPRSTALAHVLARSLGAAGVPMNGRPLRQAGFSVLKSADIPSVLVEVGFLSNPRDLANVQDPVWQAKVTEGLTAAILRWRQTDAERPTLLNQ